MAGRKPKNYQAIDTAILAILSRHASGRVPVSSHTISIQLYILYGIERPPRTIRDDLKRLLKQDKVKQSPPKGVYCLKS